MVCDVVMLTRHRPLVSQVFGSFALINVAQLFVAPIVVLNLCLIACVENFVDTEVRNVLLQQEQADNTEKESPLSETI